jgi:hypothetical protein
MSDYCIYCGDWWECGDHKIPDSVENSFRDFKPGSTVKCCSECGQFLKRESSNSVQAKAEFLRLAYIKHRKRDLNLPEWDENDIKSLGHNLRSSAESRLARKWVYEMKLHNLERVSSGAECRPFQYRKNEETGRIIKSARQCLNCGKPFYDEKNNDFCTRYCDSEYKAKLIAKRFPTVSEEEAMSRIYDRRCLICGALVRSRAANNLTCSRECGTILTEVTAAGRKKQT